ncbi:MAG: response regulator [Desulfobacterales bacterium]|jgi:PAS domain S-box-containing protein
MTEPEKWRVLIIDDEEGIRRVMKINLEDAGFAVATAENGETGLAMCGEFDPQLVITDIRMPGMTGIEVLEAVKDRFPRMEVIVVTAFGEMELAISALQHDASDFITKPVDDGVLFVALDRAKERWRTREQIRDYTTFLEKGWADTTQELMETFAFQRNLIESSMDGILGVDENDRVVAFNRSLEQMLGYQKSEVLHTSSLSRFLPPDGQKALKAAIGGDSYGGRDRVSLYETSLLSKSGKPLPVQVSATVLTEDGRSAGLVLFVRDLREIRRLEREMADQARILHQDKMMSLGRLAASVVHEINNPLAGILNYLRLMKKITGRGALSDKDRQRFCDYLEIVEQETDRCSKIVSGLLTFSRKTPPAKSDVSVADLIRRCVLLSQHRLQLGHIELVTEVADRLPEIQGDANQLQQCIINLVFNAVDAMPDGGRLLVRATEEEDPHRVVISVGDTGPGISPENLPKIFEPFFTTKKEGYGVGLGLSTVFGIVEDHGGRVAVDSRIGEGTTFRLIFPV